MRYLYALAELFEVHFRVDVSVVASPVVTPLPSPLLFSLFLRGPGRGEVHVSSSAPLRSVSDLSALVFDSVGVPPINQALSHKGTSLLGSQMSLHDYGVCNGDTATVNCIGLGGGRKKKAKMARLEKFRSQQDRRDETKAPSQKRNKTADVRSQEEAARFVLRWICICTRRCQARESI